jgi:hypothetical protein
MGGEHIKIKKRNHQMMLSGELGDTYQAYLIKYNLQNGLIKTKRYHEEISRFEQIAGEIEISEVRLFFLDSIFSKIKINGL